MRKLVCLIFVVPLLLCGTSIAQTPDGETPPNEGVCDDLMYATPGLYGLCMAFCEAQDCELDTFSEDPFANCIPSGVKILRNYERKMKEGDPYMPCVKNPCPCWTEQELADFPFPVTGDGSYCVHGPIAEAYDDQLWVRKLHEYLYRAEVFSGEGVVAHCSYYRYCEDGSCTQEGRYFVIENDAQLTTCRQQLAQRGIELGFDCFTQSLCGDGELSPGEECETDDDCNSFGPGARCEGCACLYCGDGVVTPGEECDPAAPSDPCHPRPDGEYCGSTCSCVPWDYDYDPSGCWDCGDCHDCDPSHVTCGEPPPWGCASGAVRSVVDGCWGPCVFMNSCDQILCRVDDDCPGSMTCRLEAALPEERIGVCVWPSYQCGSQCCYPGFGDPICCMSGQVSQWSECFENGLDLGCVPLWECEAPPVCLDAP